MIFLMLALLIVSVASVNSQVTIGSTDDPNPSAVLDLKTTNQGLLLPRVALVSITSYAPLQSHVAGMTVYNTAISGSGTTAVTPGIYSNDGSKWIRMAEGASIPVEGAPQITTQPTSFTFSRLQDMEGDPHSDVTSFSTKLTVVATGDAPLKYQWYQKPKNSNDSGTLIQGATLASYTVNISGAGVNNWGLHSYYCVVSNTKGSVISDVAEVALGCGAKTVDGGWLSFMCHNLGADQTLDPFTWYSVNDTASYDIKGWLFQWGRTTDGHQWRSSELAADAYFGEYDADGQIPSSATDYYGKFARNQNSPIYDWRPTDNSLWSSSDTNNPCPTGWHLATRNEWGSILEGGTTPRSGGQTKANRWTWTGNGYTVGTASTVTLYLPATGKRVSSVYLGCSTEGRYWTTDTTPGWNAYSFFMHSTWIQFDSQARGDGNTVRCIR